MHASIYVLIYLSIHPSTHAPIHFPPLRPSVHVCRHLSIQQYIHKSMHWFIHPPAHACIYPCTLASIQSSIHVFIFSTTHLISESWMPSSFHAFIYVGLSHLSLHASIHTVFVLCQTLIIALEARDKLWHSASPHDLKEERKWAEQMVSKAGWAKWMTA